MGRLEAAVQACTSGGSCSSRRWFPIEALSTALQGKGQAIVPASQGARPPSPPLAWAKVGEVADSGVATEEAYAAGEQ